MNRLIGVLIVCIVQKLQKFSDEGTKKKLDAETEERLRLENERLQWLTERAQLEAERARLDEEVKSLQNANIVAEVLYQTLPPSSPSSSSPILRLLSHFYSSLTGPAVDIIYKLKSISFTRYQKKSR